MNGAFARSHPAVNFVFFISAAVLAMLFNHPLFLGISLVSSLAYAIRLKGKTAVKSFFFFLLPLLIFVTAINILTAHYGVTTLYTFKSGNNLTLESVAYGAVTGVLVVIMILWFMCYNEVVTEDKFMHVFGKRMPHLSLLILMVLRFVPMYINQFKETIEARKGAGLSAGKNGLGRIKEICQAVSGVVTWALEHSLETADSMKSRGYGLKGRTSYSRFIMAPSDKIIIILMLVAVAVTAAGKLTGAADALYNPIIEISGFSPMLAISAVFYTLFCFTPIIFDAEEAIRWNRLHAKT
ncbi:MAG: energy-coupling factor transporter transmembrane protein EcfT [Clostridia bacterium]|nr:energy-coupling factor transporter transmembrane protein EcfT [Clostridia bacterium]